MLCVVSAVVYSTLLNGKMPLVVALHCRQHRRLMFSRLRISPFDARVDQVHFQRVWPFLRARLLRNRWRFSLYGIAVLGLMRKRSMNPTFKALT